MANKPHPLDDPPTASSSEDDELETSEEYSSSEEDEPQTQAPSAAAVPVKPTVDAAEQQDHSDSETGSETETDSDSETEQRNPPNSGSGKAVTVTTVVSPKPKLKEAQTSSTTLALPSVKSGTKRVTRSEGTSRDTKRAKGVTSGDDDKKTGEDTKKPSSTRLWLEEDEISLLQGMIDFKSDTGKSPYEDTNGYYEFIRKSISFLVSKNQFMEKIRSLRKKYMGEKSSFTKPHELKSFELSKTIWGPQGFALESAIKSNGVSKKSMTKKKLDTVRQELVFTSLPNGKNVEEVEKNVVGSGGDLEAVKESDWFENSFIVQSIAGFGIDEHSVKQRWKLVPEEMKNRFEDRFKAWQAKEIDFVLQKTELMLEVTSMIAEACKNSSN